MGSWSDSIMGGDTPLDIDMMFEDRFGKDIPVDPEAVVRFIEEAIRDGEEGYTVRQVVGYIVMDRASPMSDELRVAILSGIDEEDPVEHGWNDPANRKRVLTDFRERVVDYPEEGGKVEMPHQAGLMETILAGEARRNFVPMLDLTGREIGQIDYTKLDRSTQIHRYDGRLWTLTEGETFEEMVPADVDVAAVKLA